MQLRIATWNINSLRLRLTLLKELVAALEPDVICLQETKVPDGLFPAEEAGALGLPHISFRGMKGYNGVAILSRVPIEVHDIAPDWCEQGRLPASWRAARRQGRADRAARFLRPRRRRHSRPDAESEIRPQARFHRRGAELVRGAHQSGPRRPVGDLNIAPLEHDVWSHRQLLEVVSHTPPETEGLTAWLDTGFVDAVRHFVPAEEKLSHGGRTATATGAHPTGAGGWTISG